MRRVQRLICCYYFRAGLFLLIALKHKVSSEESPQLQSLTDSCSIWDELSGGSCPTEDEPLDLRDRCLYCDSLWGFPPLNTDKLTATQLEMNPPEGSCPIRMSHGSCSVEMNRNGDSCLIENEPFGRQLSNL